MRKPRNLLFYRDPAVVVRLPSAVNQCFEQEIPLTRDRGPIHRDEAPLTGIACH
ncbi:MAG: hypothetical protein BWY93_02206 [Euryarchaeota archaeon ADurb.BinA087]|nr:MAG: hypothetical protein BWY93_02206 [Euryarchaeota archaeon ADurb.BinA087]HPX73332.1 hypothetical protein [Methanoregulaceae archaeon]HQA80881.1 hypothetical protein [Methanoregulaceae archaeon]